MYDPSFAQIAFSRACRWLTRIIFFLVCRIHISYFAALPRETGYIAASNHISHFDPPLLGSRLPNYIDWMAMEEFFRHRVLRHLFNWLCAFPVRRDGTDRSAIKIALKRLRKGRVIGIFPEGGIRAGSSSVLEGAKMWPGAAALCVLSGKPVVPIVIMGTDRLYHCKNWLPLRRVPVWIGVGDPIVADPAVAGTLARNSVEEALARAFISLKERLISSYAIKTADLPKTPQARKGEKYLPARKARQNRI